MTPATNETRQLADETRPAKWRPIVVQEGAEPDWDRIDGDI